MRLAREFQDVADGERLPTVHSLAKEANCGTGTLHTALRALDEAGALSVHSRGSLGSFVTGVNHAKLWELSGLGSIGLAMPLPYTTRYEGLATGFSAAFLENDIPFTTVFIRGSDARVRAMAEGRVDLVLMSKLAFELSEPGHLEMVRDLGPKTYVGSHGVLVRAGARRDDPLLRIAVDPMSLDQRTLVEREFGGHDSQMYSSISYNQILRALREGRVDATVWNLDELTAESKRGIEVFPLASGNDLLNTHAVVVKRAKSPALPARAIRALRSTTVLDTAAAVLAGTEVPTY